MPFGIYTSHRTISPHEIIIRLFPSARRARHLRSLFRIATPCFLAMVAISCGDGAGIQPGGSAVTFSNASLKGQYAFSFVGTDTLGQALLAGTFLSDGDGNITSGMEDSNAISGIVTNRPFTGVYSVGTDGRGSATVTNTQGQSHFQFVVVSVSRALIIQFDTFASGSGSIDLQDPTAFNPSAFSGAYVCNFAGFSAFGSSYVAAGVLAADGRGTLSGVIDENDGNFNPNLLLRGTYAVAPSGRGTATMSTSSGTSHFSFYVLSSSALNFIELDSLPAVSGIARAQQGGPFANSSFSGDYAFGIGGQTSNGPFASAGRMTADGRGAISAGVRDDNDTFTVTQNLTFSGTYTVSTVGRGIGTLSSSIASYSVVFYMISPTEAVLMSSDPQLVSIGEMKGQQGMPFSNSSIQGHFGSLDSIFNGGLEQDVVSQITADGGGNGIGMQDLNAGLIPTPSLALTATYSTDSNGRVLANLSNLQGQSKIALYLASPSRGYLVGLDPGIAERGRLEKQSQ